MSLFPIPSLAFIYLPCSYRPADLLGSATLTTQIPKQIGVMVFSGAGLAISSQTVPIFYLSLPFSFLVSLDQLYQYHYTTFPKRLIRYIKKSHDGRGVLLFFSFFLFTLSHHVVQ
ncbi:hypothetical protein F4775DRAFT_99118 [Biscogniauxia sp. FL1348]|nr:hypothetical protein F4775DRAFT_99118 [Biscogniauxia sp. FL1348]